MPQSQSQKGKSAENKSIKTQLARQNIRRIRVINTNNNGFIFTTHEKKLTYTGVHRDKIDQLYAINLCKTTTKADGATVHGMVASIE